MASRAGSNNKTVIDVTLIKSNGYKWYRKNVEDSISIGRPTYFKMCSDFNLMLKNLVLKGNSVQIPGNLGYLYIKGSEPTGRTIDYPTTFKLWDECPECKERVQKVYYNDDESDGTIYRIVWSTKKIYSKFKEAYVFKPARHFKRAIAEEIRNGREYVDANFNVTR